MKIVRERERKARAALKTEKKKLRRITRSTAPLPPPTQVSAR
jgi:hypothetical protein